MIGPDTGWIPHYGTGTPLHADAERVVKSVTDYLEADAKVVEDKNKDIRPPLWFVHAGPGYGKSVMA